MSRRGSPRPARARPRAITDQNYAAHAGFRLALRRFLRFSQQRARTAGLTPAQHQMLLAIRADPRRWLHVGEIARELMLRPHSAAELVDRAVRQGLVAKRTDPEDLRRLRVTLTRRGMRLIALVTAEHREELRRLWRMVPPL